MLVPIKCGTAYGRLCDGRRRRIISYPLVVLSVIFCLLSVAYPVFHLYSFKAELSLCYLVLIVSPRRSLNRSIGAGCGYILVASPFCSFFLFLSFLTLCILVKLVPRAGYTVFSLCVFP